MSKNEIGELYRNDYGLGGMDKSETIKILREAGLRITPQRKAIINALSMIELLHPPVSLVHGEARKKIPGLSLSTTYAAVHELRQLGILKILEFDRRESRCETISAEHINLICDICDRITDYEIPFSIDREHTAGKTGFMITDNRLECYGICNECLDKQKAISNPGSEDDQNSRESVKQSIKHRDLQAEADKSMGQRRDI